MVKPPLATPVNTPKALKFSGSLSINKADLEGDQCAPGLIAYP